MPVSPCAPGRSRGWAPSDQSTPASPPVLGWGVCQGEHGTPTAPPSCPNRLPRTRLLPYRPSPPAPWPPTCPTDAPPAPQAPTHPTDAPPSHPTDPPSCPMASHLSHRPPSCPTDAQRSPLLPQYPPPSAHSLPPPGAGLTQGGQEAVPLGGGPVGHDGVHDEGGLDAQHRPVAAVHLLQLPRHQPVAHRGGARTAIP